MTLPDQSTSTRPGERTQAFRHVGCRNCAELWDEVCRLKRELAAMTERAEQAESVRCWRSSRHVGQKCEGIHGGETG